eukprot:scaffold13918_cov122-Isochrysis_galbana.AAC.3
MEACTSRMEEWNSTRVGDGRLTASPVPSCPHVLSPQPISSPARVRARLQSGPAARCSTPSPRSPRTSRGA